MWLRLRRLAPYRCQRCHLRFVAADNGEQFAAARKRSLASYLGLDDGYESGLIVFGSLMLLLLALLFALLVVGE